MKTIHREIVGAFIFSAENKLFLGYNRKGGVYQGKLVVPGGGIEPEETEEQALAREIMEETGIDIRDSEIKKINESSGQSEKFIKEFDEVALVDMTFHDYEVRMQRVADEIHLSFDDDFDHGEWYLCDELNEEEVGPATWATLTKNGYVAKRGVDA